MRYRISRRITPYLFICPFFIGYAVFFLYPVIWAFYLSFFQQIGFGGDSDFIGFSNYIRLAGDPVFIKSLVNTTIYAIGSFFIILPIALVLALVLNTKGLFWSNGFRLLYFTPFITSGVVVAIIFRLVFEYEYGIINNWLLQPFGIASLRWLKSPDLILPAIIILGIWRFSGINALYFLAGLQRIPSEIIESAQLDGANGWQLFRNITLPLLRPILIFVTVSAIIGSYNLFGEPFLLVGGEGGARNAGLFMTMYLYLNGFRYMKFGYASAIGYTITIIILVLSLLQLRMLRVFQED